MLCEVCGLEEAKYCCPGCEKRTCSLTCVREHKQRFNCEGLKSFPRAPPPAPSSTEKYSESLFIQDYNFLENICALTSQSDRKITDEKQGEERNQKIKSGPRSEKVSLFKRIQKTAKLAELRLLPESFSRSKRNQSHFIEKSKNSHHQNNSLSASEALPEVESSRSGRIAWTLDVVEYEEGHLIETLNDIGDDSKLEDFLPENSIRVFLRNESRQQGIEKWKEICEWRGKSLSTVLINGRCFEYPIIGVTREIPKLETELGLELELEEGEV